jgi:hypothetical protein
MKPGSFCDCHVTHLSLVPKLEDRRRHKLPSLLPDFCRKKNEINVKSCLDLYYLHQCFSTFLRVRNPKWPQKTSRNPTWPQKTSRNPNGF